jgi:hypothetical protein
MGVMGCDVMYRRFGVTLLSRLWVLNEEIGITFLRNDGVYLPNYTVSYLSSAARN